MDIASVNYFQWIKQKKSMLRYQSGNHEFMKENFKARHCEGVNLGERKLGMNGAGTTKVMKVKKTAY